MNKIILMGRLTKDHEVRYSQGEKPMAIARYTLAVERKFKRDGEPNADFINCIAFGKNGEFAEKYLHKGIKILVEGRIQTGSYTNKDGVKVYTQTWLWKAVSLQRARTQARAKDRSLCRRRIRMGS